MMAQNQMTVEIHMSMLHSQGKNQARQADQGSTWCCIPMLRQWNWPGNDLCGADSGVLLRKQEAGRGRWNGRVPSKEMLVTGEPTQDMCLEVCNPDWQHWGDMKINHAPGEPITGKSNRTGRSYDLLCDSSTPVADTFTPLTALVVAQLIVDLQIKGYLSSWKSSHLPGTRRFLSNQDPDFQD